VRKTVRHGDENVRRSHYNRKNFSPYQNCSLKRCGGGGGELSEPPVHNKGGHLIHLTEEAINFREEKRRCWLRFDGGLRVGTGRLEVRRRRGHLSPSIGASQRKEKKGTPLRQGVALGYGASRKKR